MCSTVFRGEMSKITKQLLKINWSGLKHAICVCARARVCVRALENYCSWVLYKDKIGTLGSREKFYSIKSSFSNTILRWD